MKDIFFKGLLVALPLLLGGGLLYLVFHGFYSLYQDMQLKKELAQIQRESAERRKKQPTQEPPPTTTAEDLFQ